MSLPSALMSSVSEVSGELQNLHLFTHIWTHHFYKSQEMKAVASNNAI